MIRFARRLIDFLKSKKSTPSIILIVQFHNEMERMPGFFSNVLPYVDGIIGLDDGSSDGSSDFFSAQPKVLTVIHRPIRSPHQWDEPSNRRALIQASHQYRPDWLLALDMDERLEHNFRQKVERSIRIADLLGTPKIAFDLLELWDSENAYRVDGIWGKKRRTRLFRWTPDHQIAEVAFHGPWTSVFHHFKKKSYQSRLRIYHLGTMTEADRIKRIEKYKRYDPNHQYQKIGYDYLNDKRGLRTRKIEQQRHFRSELSKDAEQVNTSCIPPRFR